MKLRTYIFLMIFVVFVGTLPHTVGALTLQNKIIQIEEEIVYRCANPAMKEMKLIAKEVAKIKVMAQFNSVKEWKALDELWYIESRWDYTADNPRSTAYGIPQLLKMDPKTPLIKQIDLGLKYIKHRYGTPTKALKFHKRHGWY
jgi:hypothetical protein